MIPTATPPARRCSAYGLGDDHLKSCVARNSIRVEPCSSGMLNASGRAAWGWTIRWDNTSSRAGELAVASRCRVIVASTRISGGRWSKPVRKARTMAVWEWVEFSATVLRFSSTPETASAAFAPSFCCTAVKASAAATKRRATIGGLEVGSAAYAPRRVAAQARRSRCCVFIVQFTVGFCLLSY
jgi:hypothetical protein